MEALPSIVKLAPRLEPSPKKGAGLKKEKTLTSEGASLMEGATMERAHAKFDEGANLKGWPTSKFKRLPYLEAHTCKGSTLYIKMEALHIVGRPQIKKSASQSCGGRMLNGGVC